MSTSFAEALKFDSYDKNKNVIIVRIKLFYMNLDKT